MDNIKPWQIILIIVAFAALGFSVWKFGFTSGIELPDSVMVVDVETGDLYKMKLGRRNGAYFPEKSPDTGKNTLMPIEKSESGEWFIVPHARPALQDINGENKVVNESTWRVEVASESALRTLNAGG